MKRKEWCLNTPLFLFHFIHQHYELVIDLVYDSNFRVYFVYYVYKNKQEA
jgi:hypothetical protein